ncbi:MAG: hypothetical protein KBD01_20005 [Acidobacteria bacterium]|nr:hypothetical protein [Acidobacteriota bacterium]
MIGELTGGIGVDRVIDAAGVDAQRPHHGPAASQARKQAKRFEQQVRSIAPQAAPRGDQ